MPLEKKLINLCNFLEIPIQSDFSKAMTFSEENEHNNNSRFIFWTKYVFKGILARWIFKNIGGDGKQLQHFLGQISSDKYFAMLFDQIELASLIPNFQNKTDFIQTKKHLYAQGFIGFIFSINAEMNIETFIQQYFILPNNHLLPENHKHKFNDWAQLVFLCKQEGFASPKLWHEVLDQGIHSYSCTYGEYSFVHQSVSIKYARKKCIRLALKHLVNSCADKLENSPQYLERLANTMQTLALEKESKRLEKIAQWKASEAAKNEERIQRKIEKAEKAKLEDLKRKQQKKVVKEKKVKKQSAFRTYSEEEIKNMTAGKRRRLEDLGILPKK